jgi:hypothetical protein
MPEKTRRDKPNSAIYNVHGIVVVLSATSVIIRLDMQAERVQADDLLPTLRDLMRAVCMEHQQHVRFSALSSKDVAMCLIGDTFTPEQIVAAWEARFDVREAE